MKKVLSLITILLSAWTLSPKPLPVIHTKEFINYSDKGLAQQILEKFNNF